MAMGRTEQAVRSAQTSLTLDPLNSVMNASLGMIRYLAHDFDGALTTLHRGLELDPTHHVSHLRVGLACLQQNRVDDAIDSMQQAVTHSGGSTEALAGLAQAIGASGDSATMQNMLEELTRADRYVSPYNVARAYGGSNDAQRALEWLEKAYREHNADLIELVREPSFASLHSNANFRDLVRRVGWEELPTNG